MFKLIKILNSGVNVPDIITYPKDPNENIIAGPPMQIRDGSLVNCPENQVPLYMSVEDAVNGETTIDCYQIDSNMIFETYMYGNEENLKFGDKVILFVNDFGQATGLSEEKTAAVATVLDIKKLPDGQLVSTLKF